MAKLTRLQQNIAVQLEFWKTMAVASQEIAGATVVTTHLADPFLNLVVNTQFKDENFAPHLEKVIDFFAIHKVPWTWWLNPLTSPAKLGDTLGRYGLKLIEEVPSFYLDLNKTLPLELPPDLSIKKLSGDDLLNDWIQAINEGFPSEDNAEGFRKLNYHLPHGANAALQHYVAYLNQQAVASITLFKGTQAVMIHNVATKVAFRKRGFATALLIYILQEAKNVGFQHCFLDSSMHGKDLYQKVGFVKCSEQSVYSLNA